MRPGQIISVLSYKLSSYQGFDLVELKLSRYKKNSRLQVFVDSDSGISIENCSHISRIIEPLIDVANFFAYGYTIEVSSPGLDRPLTTARDFKRRIGETVEIVFDDAGMAPVKGKLVSADDRHIELEIADEKNKYDLAHVKAGKIIF